MLKAIIFDMDGTIVDTEPVHLAVQKELISDLNLKLTPEDLASFMGATVRTMWSRIKKNYAVATDLDTLIQNYLDLVTREFQAGRGMLEIPGARNLLMECEEAGYPTALATSSVRSWMDIILDKMHYGKHFQYTICGDDIINSKPAPDIFLLAAEKLNIPPQHCVVIEDSRNGVLGAKAAGMKCVGLQNEHGNRQDLSPADLIVSSYKELSIDILKNLF